MDEMLNRILECMGPTHGAGKALADFLGVSPNVITNWKNGSNRSYRKYIKKIAKFYNVSEEYLLGNQTDKDPANKSEVSDEDIKFALFGGATVTDEQYEEVKRFARYIAEHDIHPKGD